MMLQLLGSASLASVMAASRRSDAVEAGPERLGWSLDQDRIQVPATLHEAAALRFHLASRDAEQSGNRLVAEHAELLASVHAILAGDEAAGSERNGGFHAEIA